MCIRDSNWSTWVNVAKISGSCIPKVEKTSACYANGSNWGIKIDTSGNVYAKIDSGSCLLYTSRCV